MFDRSFCPRVVTRIRASPDVFWLGAFLATLVYFAFWTVNFRL